MTTKEHIDKLYELSESLAMDLRIATDEIKFLQSRLGCALSAIQLLAEGYSEKVVLAALKKP